MADSFVGELRAAAPLVPDAVVLERVRVHARSIVATRTRASRGGSARSSRPLALRSLAAVGAVALAAGVFAYVFAWGGSAPHVENAAFARDKAVAALIPKGSVLHTKSVTTGFEVIDAHTVVSTSTAVEEWTDVERRVERIETLDAATGELFGFDIRKGDWQKTLGRDAAFDQKKYAIVPLQWRLVEYEVPADMRSFTYVTDDLSECLRKGWANVVDRFDEGGESYWVVEVKNHPGDEGLSMRATMRVRDYALRKLVITREMSDGPSPTKMQLTTEYSLWETISRDKLPAGFFDYNLPNKRAPKGTVIDPPRKS